MMFKIPLRYLLLASFAVFFWAGPGAYAQEVPAPGTSPMHEDPPQDPEQEMRSLSGTLKDLLGQVHQHLGVIDKQLTSGVTDRMQERLTTTRQRLDEARDELEATLNEVNASEKENWPTVKSKAETVIQKVSTLLEEVKETRTSAVN